MNDNIKLDAAKGHVDIFRLDTNEIIRSFDNTILYSGADVLAKALAGISGYTVNGMYIEYYNGTPSEPTIQRSRGLDYYTGLTSPAGYIRIATLSTPEYSTSSTNYDNNKVEFIGITDGSYELGPGLIDGTSKFYAVALVVRGSTSSADHIFSAANILNDSGTFDPITKIANASLGIKWSITFN